MRVKWSDGKVISTVTLANGIYAHVYYEIIPGEKWCFRSIGLKRECGFATKVDAKIAAEEYLHDVLNVAANNLYN